MNNIKTVLFVVAFNVLSVFNTYSQSEEIQQLTKEKKIISNEINVLKDSIKNIDKRINFLKSNDNIETGEVVITEVYTKEEATVRDKPGWAGNVIAKIPKYKKVEVYSFHYDKFQNGYWLIKRDSIKGYVHRESLGENRSMAEIEKEYDLIELSKQYGKETAKRIINHRIWIGMTPDMVRKSIGNPKDINRSKGSYGTHEQWVYKNRYLYFENGKLTSWQK